MEKIKIVLKIKSMSLSAVEPLNHLDRFFLIDRCSSSVINLQQCMKCFLVGTAEGAKYQRVKIERGFCMKF